MRVLIVTSSLARYPGDPIGAAGNALYDMLERLPENVQGTVLAPAQPGASPTGRIGRLLVRRVRPERPVASLHNAARGPGAARVLRVAWALRRAARRLAPGHDVVHAHWAFPGGWAARDLGIPLMTSFPGSDVHRYPRLPVAGRVLSQVVRASEACVALDPVGAGVLTSLGASWVEEIPHGVPIEAFPLAPLPENQSVLFVGRLAPEKGVRVLLDAVFVAALRDPRIRLTMVGDGPERTNLQRHARALRLDDRVSFLGALPRLEVAKAIARCRVVAMPSFHEAFPAVALEALAVGRPVVASAVGALPRLLAGGGGITVPPGEPMALAQALLAALAHVGSPVSLRRRALRYDVSIAAHRYADLYTQVRARADAVVRAREAA